MPVALKIYLCSIRDVKTVKKTIDEFKLYDSIIVMDRGFVSMDMINYMSDNIKCIQPLRRNSGIIDHSIRGQEIRYGNVKYSNHSPYVYEDAKLIGERISNSIVARTLHPGIRIHEERLGKISLVSNLDKTLNEIYLIYKEMEDIEQYFDAMMNEMENDKTYLMDNDAIVGTSLYHSFHCTYITGYLRY